MCAVLGADQSICSKFQMQAYTTMTEINNNIPEVVTDSGDKLKKGLSKKLAGSFKSLVKPGSSSRPGSTGSLGNLDKVKEEATTAVKDTVSKAEAKV